MTAFILAFLIFAFFTLVGRALHQLVRPSTRLIQGWLLSPALGFSVIVLLVTILNQAGWPINQVGLAILIGAGSISACILYWRKEVRPRSLLWIYALLACLSMLACGWPLFLYGFNWVSFGNADMGYYCLGADRILRNGFTQIPDAHSLAGYDWPQTLWFYVPTRARFGSEMLIAWVSSVTHLSCAQIFMPTTLALVGVQSSAAMALVSGVPKRHRVGFFTGLLLVFSPLYQLGFFYQLNSQVGGMALMLAACALSHRAIYLRAGSGSILRHAIIMAIIWATLAIYYPEISPFAGIVSVGLLIWGVVKFPSQRLRFLKLIGMVSVACILLLRGNLLSSLIAISAQAKSGFNQTDLSVSLFPYLIVPSGIANLFGFLAIPQSAPLWQLNTVILAGLLLLVAVSITSLVNIRRGEPWAYLSLTILIIGIRLFIGDSDFGLFKLGMYFQPVLMAGLAVIAVATLRKHAWIAILTYCIITAPACWNYSYTSCGLRSGSFAELPFASQFGPDVPKPYGQDDIVYSDITNNTAATLASVQLRGVKSIFLSKYFFPGGALRFDGILPEIDRKLHPQLFAQTRELEQELGKHRGLVQLYGATFSQPTQHSKPSATSREWLLRVNQRFNLLNRSKPKTDGEHYFLMEPFSQLNNHLLYVDSSLGNHYFLGDQHKISYFGQEADYYSNSDNFGVGLFLMLQVIKPSAEFYLRISLSKSVMGLGATKLPDEAIVRGEKTARLPLIGNGSAIIFAGPISPRVLHGSSYIAIDFQQNGTQFPVKKPGLMSLYNDGISLDHRQMVAFGRDISLFTKAEIDQLQPPRQLAHFPSDLLSSPGIEYSGIYEDGWISQHAYVVLANPLPKEHIQFRGTIPDLGEISRHQQQLTVQINGLMAGTYTMSTGGFNLRIPFPPTAKLNSKIKIEFSFSRGGNLASPDDRPVAGKIDFLGLSQDQ